MKRLLPLALSLAVVGCATTAPAPPSEPAGAPTAQTPMAQTPTADAPMATGTLGIDRDAMDPSVRPQDDLFRYVNGRWLETTEIPADRPRYGSFDILRERSEEDVRAIIEDAASGAVVDPDARKVGDYYAAYMDSARVERLGIAPLQPDFDRIDAVASGEDLVRYFAQNSSATARRRSPASSASTRKTRTATCSASGSPGPACPTGATTSRTASPTPAPATSPT